MFKYFLILSISISFVFANEEHKAHEHGVSSLNIAIEKRDMIISIDGPLNDFLGFEHKPATKEETQALENMKSLLKSGKIFAPAVRCDLKKVEIEEEQENEEHSDLEAEFSYRCFKPSAIEIKLFSNFPNLKKLKVSISGKKQKYIELEKDGIIKFNE